MQSYLHTTSSVKCYNYRCTDKALADYW